MYSISWNFTRRNNPRIFLSTSFQSTQLIDNILFFPLSLSLFLNRDLFLVTFRFLFSFLFFASCVYLPLKVAGGYTARIYPLNSMIIPSSLIQSARSYRRTHCFSRRSKIETGTRRRSLEQSQFLSMSRQHYRGQFWVGRHFISIIVCYL